MEPFGVGLTDIGKSRGHNEDRLYIDNDMGLYIVSDGMGGHAAGDEASRLAVDAAVRSLMGERALINRVRQGLDDPQEAVPIAKAAVEDACETVYLAARANPALAGMGSTLTLLLACGRWAVMAHVGDTRAYLFRSGAVTQLSSDHTMVAELQRAGAISAEDASRSEFRSVLTRTIGSQQKVLVETLLLDVLPGDRYLLCSDGLSQYADEATLGRYLAGELEDIPEGLVSFANESGGSDNTTVIVLSFEADEAEEADVTAVAGNVQVKFAILQSVFLFENLSLAQLQRLLNICEVKEFEAGSTVAAQGERSVGMFVVLEGQLELLRNDEVIAEVSVGECVGERSLIGKWDCRGTLRACENGRVLVIPRDRFASLIQRRPWMGLDLLTRMARRSDAAVDRLHARLHAIENGVSAEVPEATDFF